MCHKLAGNKPCQPDVFRAYAVLSPSSAVMPSYLVRYLKTRRLNYEFAELLVEIQLFRSLQLSLCFTHFKMLYCMYDVY